MLNKEFADKLSEYVKAGGVVIADEGFGLREMNTWMQPYDIDFSAVSARMRERRQTVSKAFIGGTEILTAPFRTEYSVKDSKTVLSFSDGAPAIVSVDFGKGRVYLSSFGIGYTYREYSDSSLARFIEDILSSADVNGERVDDFECGIYFRTAKSDGYTVNFIFNCSDKAYSADIPEPVVAISSSASINGTRITVNAQAIAYYVTK